MGASSTPEDDDQHWEQIVDTLIDIRERLPENDWQPQTVTADISLRSVAVTPDHLHPAHSWALGPARETVHQATLDADLLHLLIPALPDLITAIQEATRHAARADRRLAGITRERLLAIADRIELLAQGRPPAPLSPPEPTPEMVADLRRWASHWGASARPGLTPPPRPSPRAAHPDPHPSSPAAQADTLRHAQLEGRLHHLLPDMWTYPGCPARNARPLWSTTTACIRTLVRRRYLIPLPGPGLEEVGAEVMLRHHPGGPSA